MKGRIKRATVAAIGFFAASAFFGAVYMAMTLLGVG